MKSFKKSICIFLSILMIISVLAVAPITSNAAQTDVQSVGTTYSGTTGDCSWSLDTSTGVLTISGSGAMTNYSSSSDAPWYSYRSYIKTVTISYGVTTIGKWAFYNCTSLTSVTIPSSVTSIGSDAFEYCTSLTSVTIPNSVTSIGSYAFYYCTSLTSVTIPSSVTSIGSYAFEYCRSLTSITIPNSVTSIGSGTFEYCRSLTSIMIPSSVTSIGIYAFYYCTSLTSVTIPSSVTSIGSNAFEDCTSLTSVTIPSSVTSIGSYAFEYCRSLTSVTIPSSITCIRSYAFDTCTSLTSVIIPNSVTSIEEEAFENCISLEDVYYTGTESEWSNISIDSGNDPLTNATIHYSVSANNGDTTTTDTNNSTAVGVTVKSQQNLFADVTREYNVGDKFTVAINLDMKGKKPLDTQLCIKFDSTVLKVTDQTINSAVNNSSVTNISEATQSSKNAVFYNFTSLYGYDELTDKSTLVTYTVEVLGGAGTNQTMTLDYQLLGVADENLYNDPTYYIDQPSGSSELDPGYVVEGMEDLFEVSVDVSDSTYVQETTEPTTTAPVTTEATTAPTTTSSVDYSKYCLIGYIDGANVGDGDDYANVVNQFSSNGTVTLTVSDEAFVCVKDTACRNWYMTDGWAGYVDSAKLYPTSQLGEDADKLYVPAGTYTFTLVENADGSLTLSYVVDEPAITAPATTVTATTASTTTDTDKNKVTYNYYFAPLTSDVDAGYSFIANICNDEGEWTPYAMTATGETYNGRTVYVARITVPEGTKVAKLQYQTYDGETWQHHIEKDAIVDYSTYADKVMVATAEDEGDLVAYTADKETESSVVTSGVDYSNYCLIGYIDGNSVGYGDDYASVVNRFSSDGTITLTVLEEAYVCIKDTACQNWYMTDGWQGYVDSATLYPSSQLGVNADMLYVPAGEVTFTLVKNDNGTFTLSYTVDGETQNSTNSQDIGTNLSNYCLIGYIDGVNVGDGDDYASVVNQFSSDGTVTLTVEDEAFVCVKDTACQNWYMTDGWQGYVDSATLYPTSQLGEDANKLYVPAGTHTFTLVKNSDGTFTLSYSSSDDGDDGETLFPTTPVATEATTVVTTDATEVTTEVTTYPTITAGVSQTVSITTAGTTKYYKFIPTSSGTYEIYTTGSYDTYGYLYNSSMSQLSSNDDGGMNNNFKITYNLTRGTTYYIGAKLYNTSNTGSFTLCVDNISSTSETVVTDPTEVPTTEAPTTVTPVTEVTTVAPTTVVPTTVAPATEVTTEAPTTVAQTTEVTEATTYPTITAGVSQTVNITTAGTVKYYKFIPTSSGTYEIYSTGSYDTYGYLYNSSMSQLSSNDDGGTNNNFKITYNLTRGTTYYIGAKLYNTSNTGSFTLCVDNVSSTSEITLAPIDVVPTVAPTIADKLTVSVSSNLNSEVKTINVEGKTVTVIYNLTAPAPLADGQAVITYDSSKLTFDSAYNTQATMFPVVTNAVWNSNVSENKIKFNFTGMDSTTKIGKYDFTKGGVLVAITFTVKDGAVGTAEVKLNVEELDSVDNEYVTNSVVTTAGSAATSSIELKSTQTSTTVATETTATETSTDAQDFTYSTNATESTDATEITSVFTEATTVAQNTYYVVGDEALFGANWVVTDSSTLTKSADGIYYSSIENVPAGRYNFKVVASDGTWYPSGGDTSTVTVPADGTKVIFAFDPEKGYGIASIDGTLPDYSTTPVATDSTEPTTEPVTEPATTEPATTAPVDPTLPAEGTFHVVAGSPELCNGASWNPADASNLMTETSTGVYEITYTNVSAGSYSFKVTTGGAWDIADYNLTGDAKFGGANVEITVPTDGSTVKVTFAEADGFVKAYVNGVRVGGVDDVTDSTATEIEPVTKATEATEGSDSMETIKPTTPKKLTQKITVKKSYKKTYGSKAFNLNAKTNGNGKLTYSLSNKKVVTVSSKGKVTIKGCGKATITIKATATSRYKSATKKVTITVSMKPVNKTSIKLKMLSTTKLYLSWGKSPKATGYKINLSCVIDGTKRSMDINSNKNSCILNIGKAKKSTITVKIYSYAKIGKKKYKSSWTTRKLKIY